MKELIIFVCGIISGWVIIFLANWVSNDMEEKK